MQYLASAHDLRTTSRLFMGLGLYWHPAAGVFGRGGGGGRPSHRQGLQACASVPAQHWS